MNGGQAYLALTGGKIRSPAHPSGFAQAMAVSGGLIQAVGTDEEIRQDTGPGTRVVPLRGRLAPPAFGDAHVRAGADRQIRVIVSAAFCLCGWVRFIVGSLARRRSCRPAAEDRHEDGARCGVFDPLRQSLPVRERRASPALASRMAARSSALIATIRDTR